MKRPAQNTGARRALADALRDMNRDGASPLELGRSSGLGARRVYKTLQMSAPRTDRGAS